MKKRILSIILCIIMLLTMTACNNGRDLPRETQISEERNTELETEISGCIAENPATQEDDEISIAVTDFAVRLLQTTNNTVFQEDGGEANKLLSPLSVLTAMSMAANGAKNETRAQIEETFGVSIEELNQYISSYMSSLPQEEGNKFHMANSLWIKEDDSFQVQNQFLDINKMYYDADIYETVFDADTIDSINQWVEENTDGLIKEILNEIPADAVMYLINALVFDAKWEETYEDTDIREGIFTVSEGIEQDVGFMYSNENLYLEDEHATGFIKYYEGRDYAFAALLPKENIELTDYINTISGESLHNLLLNPQEVKVRTWLPQFEVEYNIELSQVLAEMGIKDAFDSKKADFSDMGTSSDGNIYIDRVIHKTYIDVSPAGTKAGAATVVEVRNECALMEPEEVKEVRLDRPFLYMIIDCETNQPIFMGTVSYVHPYRCGVVDDLCSYPLAE